MNLIAGRHKCGRKLEFRMDVTKSDEGTLSLIYGICKKCEVIVASGVWSGEEPPIPGIDYIIEWDEIAEESK